MPDDCVCINTADAGPRDMRPEDALTRLQSATFTGIDFNDAAAVKRMCIFFTNRLRASIRLSPHPDLGG